MAHLKLLVTKRSEFGRGSMKRLRTSGSVPAVVYGHSGTTALTVNEKELRTMLKQKGHLAALVDISIDGGITLLSDIADIQKNPVTDELLHVDFHEVLQTEKMTTVVPLEFFGESVGVKNNGGVLDIARHDVSVRCLPADLPAVIRVDIGGLDIDDIIHLSNLQVPAGVELIGDPSTPVVSCISVTVGVESGVAVGGAKAEEGVKAEADKKETKA
ncbi:MAG: 50S ribosomal protein L25 [Puniceicoccales bacterium]|jgi:large subunit ribosomal protein L25|nr:50S ribosomal protein L25 [Puniceicoccales bacterium]